MKKLLSIIILGVLSNGSAFAKELSYIFQYENNKGELLPNSKTLFEIKNGKVFEDTYELDGVKNIKINGSIISFTFNTRIQGFKDQSFHKVNLDTGNYYEIDYTDAGGAITTFGKCKKF